MVPFFVVDRPISLEIIKGLKIPRGKKIGLMAHANTSPNFGKAFRDYPRRQVIKMCDSAIFNLGGSRNGYKELFKLYGDMGTDYGVMLDVFRDAHATVESAKKAVESYDRTKHHFKLVAVAQGKTVNQYLDCYRQLRHMGFEHIAVGGLLKKREKTARYTNVRNEALLEQVLRRIREEYNPDWLFALGCLHPSRLELFKELDVWGDYKGWIFEYMKRDETMKVMLDDLRTNHLAHASSPFRDSPLRIEIKHALARRQTAVKSKRKAQEELFEAKRALKDVMARMLKRVRTQRHIKSARALERLKSIALLTEPDIKTIESLLRRAGVPKKDRDRVPSLSGKARLKKTKLQRAERTLVARNTVLLAVFERVKWNHQTGEALQKEAFRIVKVLRTSEQSHRIRQVRRYINDKILNQI